MHKDWSAIEEVSSLFSRASVKSQGQTKQKIADFHPNCVFLDCNSNLNWPIATKWCTKHEVAEERCPLLLQGHPSNFRVTQDKKLSIFTRIEHFRTVTPVWIHWCLWNDWQSPTWHRGGALLFFEFIHLISWSYGPKNKQIESSLSKITILVAAIKSLRFALFVVEPST